MTGRRRHPGRSRQRPANDDGTRYFTKRSHASRSQLIASATQAARDAMRGKRFDPRTRDERASDLARAAALRATTGCSRGHEAKARVALEDLTVVCMPCFDNTNHTEGSI